MGQTTAEDSIKDDIIGMCETEVLSQKQSLVLTRARQGLSSQLWG